jgi:hypothetical protein
LAITHGTLWGGFFVYEDVVGLVVFCVFDDACEADFIHVVYDYCASFVWFHVGYVDVLGCLVCLCFRCFWVEVGARRIHHKQLL